MKFSLRKHPSDQQLIDGMQPGQSQRELWENQLYLKFRFLIKESTWKHNINEDDASIAYSDAILTTINNITAGKFEGRSTLQTYVRNIFEFKCIDRIRANQAGKSGVRFQESLDNYLEILPGHNRDIVQELSEKYEVVKLKRFIQTMDDKCKRIILAWGEGYHDKEIAADLGYGSPAVAKTSRLRCLDKLKTMYNSKALNKAY